MMNKTEIKQATNANLIVESIKVYSELCIKTSNNKRGSKQLDKYWKSICAEMESRGFFTPQDTEFFNM